MSRKSKSAQAEWTPPEPLTATIQPKPQRAKVSDDVVEEVPPACPRCKCTDREKKNGTIVRQIKGVARDGRPFNRVKWTYCTCRQCKQGYRVVSRILVAE